MFVGHFAVGFGAKKFAPQVSVGTLVLAAMLADVLFLIFMAAGLEHAGIQPGITRLNALDLYDYPFSHSLLMDAVWGAVFAGLYRLTRRQRPARIRGAWILFAAVVSHWLLDFAAHRPDMPLAPGTHHAFGLGLYNSPAGLLIVEGGLWIAGLTLYVRATRARSWAGNIVLWIGVALLSALTWLSYIGPPPPSIKMMVVSDLVLFPLLLGWVYWVNWLRPAQ